MAHPNQQIVRERNPKRNAQNFNQPAYAELQQPVTTPGLGIHALTGRGAELICRFRFRYNGPKNSDTKCELNKVVKCHHAKTIF
jgi:hypothetical protein